MGHRPEGKKEPSAPPLRGGGVGGSRRRIVSFPPPHPHDRRSGGRGANGSTAPVENPKRRAAVRSARPNNGDLVLASHTPTGLHSRGDSANSEGLDSPRRLDWPSPGPVWGGRPDPAEASPLALRGVAKDFLVRPRSPTAPLPPCPPDITWACGRTWNIRPKIPSVLPPRSPSPARRVPVGHVSEPLPPLTRTAFLLGKISDLPSSMCRLSPDCVEGGCMRSTARQGREVVPKGTGTLWHWVIRRVVFPPKVVWWHCRGGPLSPSQIQDVFLHDYSGRQT